MATVRGTPVVILALLWISLCSAAFAQVTGGTITGTVHDPSGAVVPGAEVKIKNLATGVVRTLSSNGQGLYSAPNLNPGDYTVEVSAKGFPTTSETVVLAEGAETLMDFHLKLQADMLVNVEASAPNVDLSSSNLGASVGEQVVRELPLNGRDWTSLATLEPNVHAVDTQNDIALGNNARANRG